MKSNKSLRIVNIEDKTELKLKFIKSFYFQFYNDFDVKKQAIIQRELKIVERLLNREPVTGSEYQSIMSMINDTIGDEKIFNDYIRSLRSED
ncbi:hypothetical protein KAU33_08770 [Candidatus Dependentiae bacterium]|nr:hypothetical protein [Candidatus Dependentiae bacterium]